MSIAATGSDRRPRSILPRASLAALAGALVSICAIAVLAERSLAARSDAADSLNHTTTVQRQIYRLLSSLDDAETGQRGFLLTGNEGYLEPYTVAQGTLPSQLSTLHDLTTDPEQRARIAEIEPLVRDKLNELAETIRLQRAGDAAGALELVKSDRGKVAMDRIRDALRGVIDAEQHALDIHSAQWESAVTTSTYVVFGGVAVLFFTVLLLGVLASRDYRRVTGDTWVRRFQLGLAAAVQGDDSAESIASKVMRAFVAGVGADIGAVYLVDGKRLQRAASYALGADANASELELGDGLVGAAAQHDRIVHLRELPASYFAVASGVGRTRPKEVVIVPASADGVVYAVIELGFVREVDPLERTALERASEPVAVAVRSARERTRREALLEETQRQAEELQTQQEELRVTNEELEQQTRALQLSQESLENQQAELEQINDQLGDQTRSLGHQRDELARAGLELQRASSYKSQFLANMSHELRTPLNSTLILAKLLADNRDHNLTPEQIKFAQTIYGASNDLLVLINDILDLSKIEAGMLDVRAEEIPLARLADDLAGAFQPVAAQKHLELAIRLDPGAPARIDTDPTRLQQILKNLLANALKFTERGGVTLAISGGGDRVQFAVSDTGIGIAADQQDAIFEAFRQADGASTRKFGGTGLGLSISRDLARLLGGDVAVASTPGKGSTFTLVLPATYAGPRVVPAQRPAVAHAERPVTRPPPIAPELVASPPPFPDDRDRVTASSRTLLVIEDDVGFARVLYDLAHELEFLGVVATTAEAGLGLARALQPSAIVLDIGLPDRSGLAVLETLKRDARTRHVPVHVVSINDHARTVLEMGAAGWALKPVERDNLIAGIRKLEAKFTQKLRRVLIVEDDAVLRESTAKLLAADDVETTTAGTSAEALALVDRNAFDCIVLDLSLPDRSGLELLEDLARRDGGPFPPVVVYTGRSLTTDEVHALERFSRSIVVKGARSPERLLDEVTLFLHQVESRLPPDRQRMLREARDRESVFEGRRILVAEDDVRNVFALSNVLEPKGARVEIARNGREALQHLARDPEVDLVLMDVMMPEMDGLEAMRRIRADARLTKLPIIALTAKAMADDRERCLEAGANDYISKPLDVDKLLSLARVWIRK